jgi:hypothetical protein
MDFIDFEEPTISFGQALKQNVIHIKYNIIISNLITVYRIK